jgi:4-amino-4-deoxy-L-arabinose transferase-like glycosyltransferase
MSSAASSRWLWGIVCIYFVLATLYSFATPPFEASDELWHYPMVQYLADNGLQLPPQENAVNEAWRQEGSQPPLYYMIAALLTSAIDTSDLDYWRRINPHANIGEVHPDRNVNMIVHRPQEATNRFTGALLALQLSRFLSIAIGAGTVIVTWHLGRALFPNTPTIPLIAAAFNACLPMFLFISSSVNNDNLSNLLGNLLTLLVVHLLLQQTAPSLRQYALLGVIMGAGLLAKLSLGFFIVIIALCLLIMSLRLRQWQPFILGGLTSGVVTIVIAGWWYLRNWQLYGDPTGLNMFLDIVGRRAIPANAAQLWAERDSYMQAFWGFFGGVNVPMTTDIYTVFNIFGIFGMVSAIAFVILHIVRQTKHFTTHNQSVIGLPHAITILWIVVTFVSYLRWTADTPASQGRLVFVALSSICIWLAVGWTWWLPRTIERAGGMPVGWAGLIALLMPFTTITAAYQTPTALEPFSSPPPDAVTFSAPDGGRILVTALTANEDPRQTIQPSQYARIRLYFQVEEAFSRDWSLFTHLVTEDGVIIGQRDVYPGGGTLATSDLLQNTAWTNEVAVWIPANAYTPQTLDIVLGWYHLPTGERMIIANNEDDTALMGQIELLPRESSMNLPNPLQVNFGRQIELVGYSLSDLSPAASAETQLTLYWRGLQPIETDYIVFAQIIDPLTTTIYAASNAMPVQWNAPTSTWQPGVIIEDTHALSVNADTPPGIYEIYVGLYTQDDAGNFNRLRVITPDGGEAFDYTQLTRVRVLPEESN